MHIDENLHWLLSFYRTSEISGALFFGQLARGLRPSAIQQDMTRHFADEAQHARYWTDCLAQLGSDPLRLGCSYQDQYVSAAGMPANLMEVLAITQVFERRVVSQYALHARAPGIPSPVQDTLEKIMVDERWHLQWVHQALNRLAPTYGRDCIQQTLQRFTAADCEVYARTLAEHRERVDHLHLQKRNHREYSA